MIRKNVLNEREAAQFLGVAVQTLRNWRSQRRGVPYLKIGRAVRYRLEDLENFISDVRIVPEASECGGQGHAD